MAKLNKINHFARAEKLGKILDSISEIDLNVCLITDRDFTTDTVSDLEVEPVLDEGKVSISDLISLIEKAIEVEIVKSQVEFMNKFDAQE
jgi:hypothetical protein